MTHLQIFDSSLLIPWLRDRINDDLISAVFNHQRFALCSVVWIELYAGTMTKADKQDLDQIQRALSVIGRMISPEPEDFFIAGQMMSFYSRTYGRLEPAKHTNDVLIALCAVRSGAELITIDKEHMRRWQKIFKRFGKPLHLRLV